jgi:hypothetical protein
MLKENLGLADFSVGFFLGGRLMGSVAAGGVTVVQMKLEEHNHEKCTMIRHQRLQVETSGDDQGGNGHPVESPQELSSKKLIRLRKFKYHCKTSGGYWRNVPT